MENELTRLMLTEAEALLVCDALKGDYLTDGRQVPWAQVEDAIRDGLAETRSVGDGAALVEKLRRSSLAQNAALVDAVERFWQQPEREAATVLREVGLVR